MLVLAALVLAGCDAAAPLTAEDEPEGFFSGKREMPLFPTPMATQIVPDQYIVVFKDEVAASNIDGLAGEMAGRQGGRVLQTYAHALKGFTAQLTTQGAAALEKSPDVAYVAPDQYVYALGTQTDAPWNLDRIDQAALPLDSRYGYGATGSGVTVFIIDTGIRTTHADFDGRASAGFDAFGEDGQDCHGHGTHVAGIVGGETWGVAKNARLVAVRVLNCYGSGSIGGVIAGIDWVTQQKLDRPGAPMVANMSLGGGLNTALDDAVRRSIRAGVTYAVAAGNAGTDACGFSPARVAEAITVGATRSSDERPTFSNFGPCVDIFAPGLEITSTYYTSDTATATMRGTSMASPHVAGVAALYLQSHPGASPSRVLDVITRYATPDRVRNPGGGSPNLLLYASLDGSTPPSNARPAASFLYTANGLEVSFTDQSRDRDEDGSVVSWRWDFGDGDTSTLQHPTHRYAAEGTYTVTLTVTDDQGARGRKSKQITVSEIPPPNLELSTHGYLENHRKTVALTWQGATTPTVDLYRDGALVEPGTSNDGSHTDVLNIPLREAVSTFTYQVCEAGTLICSNTSEVTF